MNISKLTVMQSNGGYYVGRSYKENNVDMPYSKDSDYFQFKADAYDHLEYMDKDWSDDKLAKSNTKSKPISEESLDPDDIIEQQLDYINQLKADLQSYKELVISYDSLITKQRELIAILEKRNESN